MTLPRGGVLPGSGWPGNRSVAWTAETGSFPLYYASAGAHQRAARLLAWLGEHRTSLGALPEQLNGHGQPASVAPLAWTDAVVLRALLAQAATWPSSRCREDGQGSPRSAQLREADQVRAARAGSTRP